MKASVFISLLLYCLENAWGYIWGKCGILWTAARQKALEDKYKSDPAKYADYKMGALYGARWIGHFVADCANLLRWCAKKSGDEKVHSGSNLIWDCDLSAKGALKDGKRTDGQELKPGTFVFTGDSYDKHGHVGGYIGNGEVIEDAETKKGVIKSKITDKKWTWWGERKGMVFDVPEGTVILPAEDAEKPGENAPSAPSEPADDKTDTQTLPTLRKGDKGDSVKYLQTLLLERGYDLGKWGADGDFGNATEKAVKAFQKAAGLTQDGICGEKTWAAIEAAEKPEKRYTVTVPDLPKEAAEKLCKEFPGATMKEL